MLVNRRTSGFHVGAKNFSPLHCLLLLVALVFFISTPVHAEEALGKIAYVDLHRALNDSDAGKRIKNILLGEFGEREKKLEMLQADLAKSKAGLDYQAHAENADSEKASDYQSRYLEVQQKLAAFHQEMGVREERLTQAALKQLKQIVADVGRERNYSLVLETSQDVVLYQASGDDITDEVMSRFDRRAKKGH